MKDIVLGQYINGDSVLHRLDPRTKILFTIAYIVMLFLISSIPAIAVILALVLLLYRLVRVPFKLLLNSLKGIIFIVLFTAAINIFFVQGEVVFSFWKISITREGIRYAALLSMRIIALLAGTSLLTYTTTPMQLTSGLEKLMEPLTKIGFPAHELAMMMSIALRFIPTLLEETEKIMSAQKSRGADIDTGSFIQRIKSLTPILVPLFVSAFRRADELALAMECRCYTGEGKRTKLHELKFSRSDAAAALFFAVISAGLLVMNRYV